MYNVHRQMLWLIAFVVFGHKFICARIKFSCSLCIIRFIYAVGRSSLSSWCILICAPLQCIRSAETQVHLFHSNVKHELCIVKYVGLTGRYGSNMVIIFRESIWKDWIPFIRDRWLLGQWSILGSLISIGWVGYHVLCLYLRFL